MKLSLGGTSYDPSDPMGKMFFNILATFAEFEVDHFRMRTREGMAIAKGKLKGRAPKLSAPRRVHLLKLHAAGEHTIAELAELFEVSRPPSTGSSNAAKPRPPPAHHDHRAPLPDRIRPMSSTSSTPTGTPPSGTCATPRARCRTR